MKNVFKIFGLALLASTLIFTACKKDDEEETNTNNEQQQEQTTPSLRLVFDGTTTTTNFGYMKSIYLTKADTALFSTTAATSWEGSTITFPYFDVLLRYENGEQGGWSVRRVEYGNVASKFEALTNEYETATGNWWFFGLKDNGQGSSIGSLDPTNVVIDHFTLLCVMYDQYAYDIEDNDNPDKKELDVYAQNIKYRQAQTK